MRDADASPAGGSAGTPAAHGVGALLFAMGDGGQLGEGSRPSALVEVVGRTLLSRSLSTLEACPAVRGVVVVAQPGTEREAAALAGGSPTFVAAVPGGGTRRESAARGLDALPPAFEVVVCHDVARPLATPELFAAVIGALDGADAAVPQVPVADTVKRVDGGMVRETVPRAALGVVQTPQAFRRRALAEASRGEELGPGAGRDDLSLAAAGFRVVVVPGDPANLEVRTLQDLRFAEALLAERPGRGHGP